MTDKISVLDVILLTPGPRGRLGLPAILWGNPGCVDGDAEIRVNRAGRGFALSLRAVCKRFNGGMDRGMKAPWDPNIPTLVRSLCGADLRLHRLEQALPMGMKDVVSLTLVSGKRVRLTPDHEVKTPSGWTPAGDLGVGDVVLVNGASVCPSCRKDDAIGFAQRERFDVSCCAAGSPAQ